MIKRSICFLILLSAVVASMAAMLMAVIMPGYADFSSGLVLSSLTREPVVTLMVDASWTVSVSGLEARDVGILGIVSNSTGVAVTYEFPLQADKDVPGSDPIESGPAPGGLGSESDPYPYETFKVQYQGGSAACYVPGSSSTDSYSHQLAAGQYGSLDELITACESVFVYHTNWSSCNAEVNIMRGMGDAQQVTIGDYDYYVEPVRVAWYCDNQSLMGDMHSGSDFTFIVTELPDFRKPFKRTGSGFVADSSDSDWLAGELVRLQNPSVIQFVDEQNNIVAVQGSLSKTVIYAFVQQGANVFVKTVTLGADGALDVIKEEIIRNVSVAFVAAATIAAGGGTSGSGSGSGGDSGVVFLSDYARSGEANTAAEKLLAGPDEISEPELPENSDSEIKEKLFGDTFAEALSWEVAGHSSECPVAAMQFDFFGQDFSLEFKSHCDILTNPDVSNVAQVCFMLIWLISAIFIVTRA
jgi:hypothetical protein